MADDAPITFTAIRKFVVAPDRCYRVELMRDSLDLVKIGSQFAGMDAASPNSAPMGTSPGAKLGLTLGGIALCVVSVLLLVVAGSKGWILTPLVVTAAAGVIMAIAGFVRPTPERIASGRDNLSIPLSNIQRVELSKPTGRSARAELSLHLKSDAKPLKLTVNSQDDYRVVSTLVVPRLSSQ